MNPKSSKPSFHKYSKSSIPQNFLSKTPAVQKSCSYLGTSKTTSQLKKISSRPSAYQSEESTEKFKIPSKSPLLSQTSRQNLLIAPDDEKLLNTIRVQEPKAEIQSSPSETEKKNSNQKNSISGQIQEYEQLLRLQREKYRKLESQYNELLNKNSYIEGFYLEILKNMQMELEITQESKGRKVEEVSEVYNEVTDIKAELVKILQRSQKVSKKIKQLGTVNK